MYNEQQSSYMLHIVLFSDDLHHYFCFRKMTPIFKCFQYLRFKFHRTLFVRTVSFKESKVVVVEVLCPSVLTDPPLARPFTETVLPPSQSKPIANVARKLR